MSLKFSVYFKISDGGSGRKFSDSVPRADFPMKISPPVSATKTQSPTSSLGEEGLDKFPARSNAVDFTAHAKRPRIWSMARGGIHQNKHQAVSKNAHGYIPYMCWTSPKHVA